MEQVADDIYRLGSRSHNFYLIHEDGQLSVIDAGCSGEWSELVDSIEALGAGLSDVEGVVATHAHSDHLGLAPMMQAAGMSVAVHEQDEPRAIGDYEGRYAAKPTDLPLWSIRAWRNMIPIMRAGVLKLEYLELVETFSSGDELPIPGRPVAIHTPGHTEGHTMFHCVSRGVLFTGDGLVTMDLLGNGVGPQRMPRVFDLDSEQAEASLQRIVDIPAELILPGHGEPWTGTPRRAVEIASR